MCSALKLSPAEVIAKLPAEQPIKRQPSPALLRVNLAAAENLTPELFGLLSKLGLSVVIVFFDGLRLGHPVFDQVNLAESLGGELVEVRAGSLDSVAYLPTQQWIFFHASDLAKAVATLKAGLERRGLLNGAEILTAESPDALLRWWPTIAETIRYVE